MPHAPTPAPAPIRPVTRLAEPARIEPHRIDPVRAAIRQGTVVVVRDHRSVQVGLARDRAVVVDAPATCGPRKLAELLGGLVGDDDLAAAAERAGIDPTDLPEIARILVRLAALGHVTLDTGHPTPRDLSPRPDPVRRVFILGAGQISESLRGPLAVNGCRVTTGKYPGLALDTNRPPWHRSGPPNDLVILTGTVSVDPVITATLTRTGTPHMHVHSRDGRVVVGPTVIPGATPCLTCIDLYRTRRDERWPIVAAQLIDRVPDAGIPAVTAAVALVLSEISASRDPGAVPQTLGATVEINPAEGLWNRLEWPSVPDCGCGAATNSRPLS